jgi:Tripartite tricarboxylate transporter TctB family.
VTATNGFRAPFAIVGSVLVFACLIERAGLFPATFASTLVATFTAGRMPFRRAVVYALCLAVGLSLLFVYGLHQPISLLGH